MCIFFERSMFQIIMCTLEPLDNNHILPPPLPQEIQFLAPMRLMKLEFQGPEMDFLKLLAKAEQTLSEADAALAEKANVKDILRKHKVRHVD